MKKVKIFHDKNFESLEKTVNMFLQELDAIDIIEDDIVLHYRMADDWHFSVMIEYFDDMEPE